MRLAILIAVFVCAAARSDLALASGPAASLARFSVIYPEAELKDDDDDLQPNAVWLRPAVKNTGDAEAMAAGKLRKTVGRKGKQPPPTVAPLRRQRPKSEVDPPKTRRRSLGW
ncbi:MAG TPA: hypothetical protein VNH11_30235 [Pirellulales bacterium]|nr:hypothetical protein [Pirellulales bacterium]